jgi:hypothetical protein
MPISGEKLQDRARDTTLALPGVSHGRSCTEQLDAYKVAGKVFLIVTDDTDDTDRHPQGRTGVRAAAATRRPIDRPGPANQTFVTQHLAE